MRRGGILALVHVIERVDPEFLARICYRSDRSLPVRIEVRLTHSHKGPTCALKLSLTGHVALVFLGAVPFIAIAFNRQSGIDAFHDQVDTFAGDLNLWPHRVPLAEQLESDVDFEPTLVRFGLAPPAPRTPRFAFQAANVLLQPIKCSMARVLEEAEESSAQILGAEVVLLNAVEEPHLVACSAHRYVESPLIR